MHPDLEVIVLADEEARSRVALAEERRARELKAASEARDTTIAARRKEASDGLDRELQSVGAASDARVAELQRQQAEYLAHLREAGERRFAEAVALYRKLVCGAAS